MKSEIRKREYKEINSLLGKVRSLVISARKAAARNINAIQTLTNFGIGRLIVEHEQSGRERAEYGKKILIELSQRLSDEFGRGFSRSNLEYMRKFYLMYRDRKSSISQTVSGKSLAATQRAVSTKSIDQKDCRAGLNLPYSMNGVIILRLAELLRQITPN